MLNDLILVYEKFYEPLPGVHVCVCVCVGGGGGAGVAAVSIYFHVDSYSEFKKTLHQLFPIIIDTKHLCYAFQKV